MFETHFLFKITNSCKILPSLDGTEFLCSWLTFHVGFIYRCLVGCGRYNTLEYKSEMRFWKLIFPPSFSELRVFIIRTIEIYHLVVVTFWAWTSSLRARPYHSYTVNFSGLQKCLVWQVRTTMNEAWRLQEMKARVQTPVRLVSYC